MCISDDMNLAMDPVYMVSDLSELNIKLPSIHMITIMNMVGHEHSIEYRIKSLGCGTSSIF